jgi:FMN phosphatase YigB (HAD superfamily)
MIKTIIFDFGDVFINLDKVAFYDNIKQLGISTPNTEMHKQASLYEKGLITTSEFTNYFTRLFPYITANRFINTWNSIILNFPSYRLDFIKQLSKAKLYNLILLSNTNELHIERVIQNMTLSRYKKFKSYFNQFYLSHEINLSKPHREVYEYVLKQNNLNPHDCLFIDDTPQNTAAAAKLGIHVWTIDPNTQDVIELFNIKKELF